MFEIHVGLRPKIRKILFCLGELICKFLPVNRKKIVFDNFGGKGFGDDPKYIAQHLHCNYPELKLYWLVNKSNRFTLPSYITPVPYVSFMHAFHMSTARVWVDNVRSTIRPQKRRGQFYIQTWHGGLFWLKKVEGQVDGIEVAYKRNAIKDGKITDLMYSNSDFVVDLFKKYFWYNGKIIKCGLPRLVPLVNISADTRKRVINHFKLDNDVSIVLYAPTFRKYYNREVYTFDYHRILARLDEKFKKRHVLFVRLHPNIQKHAKDFNYSDRIIEASSYPDMQELLIASDILINDYSSSMFEFSCILKRPVFILAKDIDIYMNSDRDFNIKLSDLPFSIAKTDTELLTYIEMFKYDVYLENVNKFSENIGLSEDGCGDKYIGKIIYEKTIDAK